MVLGRQPEDGHVRTAGDGSIFCFANRGRCFEDGEERAAKQRHLLAGDHRAGAVAQPRDVLKHRISSAETAVLLLQQIAKRLATERVEEPGGVVIHCGGIGTGRVEGSQRFTPLGEVQKQPAETRQHGDGITLGLHLLHPPCARSLACCSFSSFSPQRCAQLLPAGGRVTHPAHTAPASDTRPPT